MIGNIPVLLIYAFMAWARKASLLQKHNLAESFIVLFAGSTIKNRPKIGEEGPKHIEKTTISCRFSSGLYFVLVTDGNLLDPS
jgi:hypothetical protein